MHVQNFFVVGISYQVANSETRSKFVISNERYVELLEAASLCGVEECFVLSTCNRTEVYGVASSAGVLARLLCSHCDGDEGLLAAYGFAKSGKGAIHHLFRVITGLESQVLGDNEILGQMKKAIGFSRERGMLSSFLDRLANGAIQTAKMVKTKTALNTGAASVSFAAVQALKQYVGSGEDCRILLYGLGSIGRSTALNIKDHLGCSISVINRTDEVAYQFAQEHDFRFEPYSRLADTIRHSDVVIVATGAATPTLTQDMMDGLGNKTILDMSIPNNVSPSVGNKEGVKLVDIDALSVILSETEQSRLAESPKAEAMIMAQIQDFVDWCEGRKQAALIKQLKVNIALLYDGYSAPKVEDGIKTSFRHLAGSLRQDFYNGCECIEVMNQFI